MKKLQLQCKHTFGPVFNDSSRILILGSFPSVKSREAGFYYYHPQNRFWRVLANLLEADLPLTIEEKKAMLLHNHIAIWDVIESCDIEGSSDTSIKNVIPANINRILEAAPIERIYANGGKAFQLYQKYCYNDTKREIIKLPSTSPANASFQLERLCKEWSRILN